MTRAAKFDVFLSYNRAEDGAAAERLRDALRARGLTVFFDRDHIAPGARWQPILEAALATCGSVAICIGGPGSGAGNRTRSNWRWSASGGTAASPSFRCFCPAPTIPASIS